MISFSKFSMIFQCIISRGEGHRDYQLKKSKGRGRVGLRPKLDVCGKGVRIFDFSVDIEMNDTALS